MAIGLARNGDQYPRKMNRGDSGSPAPFGAMGKPPPGTRGGLRSIIQLSYAKPPNKARASRPARDCAAQMGTVTPERTGIVPSDGSRPFIRATFGDVVPVLHDNSSYRCRWRVVTEMVVMPSWAAPVWHCAAGTPLS